MLKYLSPLLLIGAFALCGCGGQAKKADEKPADPASGVAATPTTPGTTTPGASTPDKAPPVATTPAPSAKVDTSAVSALLKFVPAEAIGCGFVNSQQALSRPLLRRMLQTLDMEQEIQEEFGREARVLNIFGYADEEGELRQVVCTVREFASVAEARDQLEASTQNELGEPTKPTRQSHGFDVYELEYTNVAIRDNVLVRTNQPAFLEKSLAQTGPPAHLQPLIEQAGLENDAFLVVGASDPKALAFATDTFAAEMGHGPPPLRVLAEVIPKVKTLVAAGSLAEGRLAHLQVEMTDAAAAKTLVDFGNSMLPLGRQAGLAAVDGMGVDPPATVKLKKALGAILDGVQLTQEGTSTHGVVTTPADVAQWPATLGPIFVALKKKAEETNRPRNDLKQIGLAMANFHDAHRNFPPAAIIDESGKPLLSWRVAILPYLEESALYDKFKLDEPWDSPHNLKLAEQMPAVFGDSPDGRTRYLAFANKGSAFELKTEAGLHPFQRGIAIDDFTDGASNTLAVVRVAPDKAVPWTKPEDITYDVSDPLAGVGELPDGKLLACFVDSSIHLIDLNRITKEQFKILVERADDTVIDFDFDAN
ncbi:DUF1559 family PulG-like putative transporter [Lignipirellula cremea]|uniref:DUF1559 domain-containing protein n=1 Tax=Lignipirellula cremea TaxID=2528010 RepID=A0A518DQ57_9BACT|nr:DUF1559 domain-containing protein [Lignipirellula cremea]QDU93979.1 hypothetical protein Pla8534_17650 [Lignipirellula cremea]